MLRLLCTLALLLTGLPVAAQVTLPDWTVAPTAPFVSIGWDASGDASWGMFTEGLGIAPRWNVFKNQAGTLSLLSFEAPFFVAITPSPDGERFAWRLGFAVSTLNVIGVGAALRMVDVGPGADFGALHDYQGRPDWSILLSIGFNITNGQPVTAATSAAGAEKLPLCIGH